MLLMCILDVFLVDLEFIVALETNTALYSTIKLLKIGLRHLVEIDSLVT